MDAGPIVPGPGEGSYRDFGRAVLRSAAWCIAIGAFIVWFGLAVLFAPLPRSKVWGVLVVLIGWAFIGYAVWLLVTRRAARIARDAAVVPRDPVPDLLPDLPPVPPPFRRSGGPRPDRADR